MTFFEELQDLVQKHRDNGMLIDDILGDFEMVTDLLQDEKKAEGD